MMFNATIFQTQLTLVISNSMGPWKKPVSHVSILGTILNIFDVFVAVFFSLLNFLNLVERRITSRYLFLCV